MSDLVRALAFAFRRKGAEAVAGHDLRFVLAFDLRWLAPEDAKRAVTRGLEAGLLREEEGLLRPTFDPQAVEVPLNFRPGAGFLDEPVPTDLPAPRAKEPAPRPPAPEARGSPEAAVPPRDAGREPAGAPFVAPGPAPGRAPSATPAPSRAGAAGAPPPPDEPDDALVQEERQRRGRMVSPEVAALVVARRAGVDVRERAAAMAQAMLTRP